MEAHYKTSIIGRTTQNIYYIFYFIYMVWIQWYRRLFPLPQLPPPEKPLTPTDIYINKNKDAFLSFMSRDHSFKNANTDPIFYDIELYNELMEEPKNFLEEKWKGKMIIEYTPRGLIMMTYDAFKKGFTYYSDTQSINYNVLNAVAMKYVKTFCCGDLFMDNSIYPDDASRLIEIQKEFDKNEVKKKEENNATVTAVKDKMKNKDGPFAKLKNYKLETPKEEETKTEKKEEKIETKALKTHSTNLFIYGGKMGDSMLKIERKKHVLVSDKPTNFDYIFVSEQAVQKQVMSYKDFKALKK